MFFNFFKIKEELEIEREDLSVWNYKMRYKKDDSLKKEEDASQDDYSQTETKIVKKQSTPKKYGKVNQIFNFY